MNNFRSMSINVTERNRSDCKYVEIFTHRVGSIDAPNRRTGFIRGTNTKQWEVHKIAGRNTKANIFQEGCAGFKVTIDMNKTNHQNDVSFHVKNVDLISLRQKCMEYEGKNDKNRRTQTSTGCAQAYWHQPKWWSSKLPKHIPTWTWVNKV
jgi:hypothetical protein